MAKLPTITCEDGEAFTYKWVVKRGGAIVDLTGKTVTISMRDKDQPPGTLRINDQPCSVPVPANGEVFYTFTTANTSITESTAKGTHVEGEYRLKFVGGSDVWKRPRGKFVIDWDPMIAAT